ncbi:hypothetical protein A2303_01210 [Candidatus Falkowbacteria bacterium RIFOXYB2_FULL_47_14]|uniref:DUF3566 domain-containing protein n=1 Tax=Candidatus Falkowbacteria bacterium RIFOXYA2_FULL_47_19 TaxID=1797994 RepID=A0A1F5SJW4_9BACT|nr:MAG: hypothetical protein A2227_06050 [Candidatus Falkowbacteria bacterium RIFOXYA2_FULL_47_19]OGF34470.1 MAG: hypothetical protein A2468_04550 [Candidatus Falkowbacteria bacterium RIFOXYC2_FULL_46_15]OGF43509.1 MAG: hypothetical protein A2303_01210 [Candidatus Falkowbacteria bacterium RIFOXYB2_FULL_47_14]
MGLLETLNPKLREFFEKKKDITIIGVMWAFYWRWLMLMLAIFLTVGILAAVIGLAVAAIA